MNRYARQQKVPEFGIEGQQKLQHAKLLVVGAGGLASPLLQYLVGAGVGQITLVDHDQVDLSNLHRQTLFCETDQGQPKAVVMQRRLSVLNPDTSVVPNICFLDPSNAKELVNGHDLILDCADSFAVSYVLSDECKSRKIPMISASVLGLFGYVGVFCGNGPSLRAVFPELPTRLGNCAANGVLGPVVGTLGSLQAQLTIAWLIGQKPSPLGQLITFDANTFRFGGFSFFNAPEPLVNHHFIAPNQILPDDLVIDLRSSEEAELVMPTALRLDVAQIKNLKLCHDIDRRIALCCRSGLRSWQAAEILAQTWSGQIVLVALGDSPPLEKFL